MTVVGVVADVRHHGPASPPRPEIYQPLGQASFTSMAFVVRTDGDAAAIAPALRAAVARRDPMQPISRVSTMDEHIARALSRPHFMSTLIGSFAVLALLLAVVGIYGVMALTRVLAGQLFGVTPTDPLTYTAVAALLIGVTLLAGAIPAARATRIDPTLAMRS
jgi:putative ABC transport system permease protein